MIVGIFGAKIIKYNFWYLYLFLFVHNMIAGRIYEQNIVIGDEPHDV